ncbi:hypothetical protein [Phycicoccus flavus]|uniref:Uncharacterized protein n=1 Tax=Phycicoccus flavus TaxID=2502783 RepID=A0A8T6R601_9MICO|nr:hypothetical protein [Phycicoccus flavus]NHA68890.1 hypothetical protein [Phycicoccus flavus]
MTQQTAPAPTAGTAPAPPAPQGRHASTPTVPRGVALLGPLTMGSTPAALVRLRALSAAVVLLATALSALLLVLGWTANRAAAADTEQLIRAQSVKTDLLRADALATNAFLVGGQESPASRAAYDDALTSVTETIAAAARAQPADQQVLARLNADVLDYASTMELARANNRQGLPVGSAYLRDASGMLRSDLLPLTDALVTANSDRAEGAMGGQHPVLLVLVALVPLAVLLVVNQWLAGRFRRGVNVGLAVAALAVVAATVAAVAVAGTRASDNTVVRQNSYATVVDGADARTAGNDAKSDESLRLIARGSGQSFEDAWTAAAARVDTSLQAAGDATAQEAWQRYRERHAEIVDLDQRGNWDEAVRLATGGRPDSATAAFAEFDSAIATLVSQASGDATAALRGGTWQLLGAAVVWVLLGLAAAASAWRGLTVRLREYA